MTIVNMVGGGGSSVTKIGMKNPYLLLRKIGQPSSSYSNSEISVINKKGTFSTEKEFDSTIVDDIIFDKFKNISTNTTKPTNTTTSGYTYHLAPSAHDLFFGKESSGSQWFSETTGKWYDWNGSNSTLNGWEALDFITPDLGDGEYYIECSSNIVVYVGVFETEIDPKVRQEILPKGGSHNNPFKFTFKIIRENGTSNIQVKPSYYSGYDLRQTTFSTAKHYNSDLYGLAFIPNKISHEPF